jgi:hypothetical protein
LERLISRVSLGRGSISFDDPSSMDDFDESDPRALGRLARTMGEETGEDMPGEYEDMVRQLEAGKIPEDDDSLDSGGTDGLPL